jgi:hypothetical protein
MKKFQTVRKLLPNLWMHLLKTVLGNLELETSYIFYIGFVTESYIEFVTIL